MSLVGRRSIRFKNELQFVNSNQKLFYSSTEKAFCFQINQPELIKICFGKDGISSTVPFEVNINNTEAIDVNLASETIGITTTQEILVDTGLTELGISSFPATNANVDIVAQTLPVLQVSSGSTDIASEDTLQQIINSISAYKATNPLEEKLYSQANLIYDSNYKGINSNSILFMEDENTSGTMSGIDDYGLRLFSIMTGSTYERLLRFFPYRGGRTLYVYTCSNVNFAAGVTTEFFHKVGLQESSSQQIFFNIYCSRDSGGVSLGFLQIVVQSTAQDLSTVVKTINQNEFNIDIIDGTGPSGFTYESEWATQKFFILTDDNLHYTFGLINGFNLIPIHSFSQNDIVGSLSEGGRLGAHRPFYEIVASVAPASLALDFLGFSIYKDLKINYKNSYTIIGNNTNIDGTVLGIPFLALRYRDISRYRGNIQITDLNTQSNRIRRIFIYYGTPNNPLVLVGATWSNTLGNIQYDTGATSYTSGGNQIASFKIRAGINNILLEDIIDWKLFGYDGDFTGRTEILFTAQNLGGGTGNFFWNLVFKQF